MEAKVSESRPRSLSCASEQTETCEPKLSFAGLKTPWEEFYHFQAKYLSRIAAGMGVPPDQIADVLQEVWLAAVEHAEEFHGDDAEQRLSSWLVGVARNKSIDTIRRLCRRRRLPIESLDNLAAEPVDHEAKGPAELMIAQEGDKHLAATLEELRAKNALNCRLVCRHILEGRSLPDLAADTGLGVHAISCRIDRALKDLGGNLQEWRPAAIDSERRAPKVRRRKK